MGSSCLLDQREQSPPLVKAKKKVSANPKYDEKREDKPRQRK